MRNGAQVEELIRFGADKEARDNGRTPLHLAAVLGQAAVAALLLKLSAEADARDVPAVF